MNSSNKQLQVTIPNGCGFEPDDLVKIVPFDKRKKVKREILKHVLVNKANNQLIVTVPRVSGLIKDDLIEIVPMQVNQIDVTKYEAFETDEINKKGKLKGEKNNE